MPVRIRPGLGPTRSDIVGRQPPAPEGSPPTIGLLDETIITLMEAARRPPRLNGMAPHQTTLWRWTRSGVRGIRLETIQVGGTTCTSVEALQRFCDRLTRAREARVKGPPKAATPVV